MTSSGEFDGSASSMVEEFGVRIGLVMGWPRMAGRLMATLMLHRTSMTTDELRDSLGASTGAVSESSRLLVRAGVIERKKTPGHRKASFAYREDAWVGCLQHSLMSAEQLRSLAESALSGTPDALSDVRARLSKMREYYVELERTYAELQDRLTADI